MPSKVRFSISATAKLRIESLINVLTTRTGASTVIPAIMWLDKDLNALLSESQPAIGFYDDASELAEDDILVVDGLKIVLAVSDADTARFDGKTLDYEPEAERFMLK
jgi:hypothetical protein